MNLLTPGANALFAGTAMPTTVYVQLHTDNPGTNGTANVATDSRRIEVVLDTPSGGAVVNSNLAQLFEVTADDDITHISVWSLSAGGVAWLAGAVTGAPITIEVDMTVNIPPGELVLTADLWV